MAWYPDAIKKNIRPGSSDPAIQVVGAILHVRAGVGDSLFPYFNGPSGGIESHFYIRFDGTVEQYRSTGYEADANYKANSFIQDGVRKGFVSIETEGYGEGEWTPAQLESIKDLLRWVSRTHSFPLTKCSGPFSPGVGYHVMWGSPGPWTPVAKSCPGPQRIAQFNRVLVPWFNGGAQEEDMTPKEAFRAVWTAFEVDVIGSKAKATPLAMLKQAHNRAGDARAKADAALEQSKRNRRALRAMADSLPKDVKANVIAALGEEVDITLTVQPKAQKPTA